MSWSSACAFEEIRRKCLDYRGVSEEYPWGDVAWKVGGKIFAIGTEGSSKVSVKSLVERQEALLRLPNVERASHVGRYGWVTVDAADYDSLDLALQLIDESYRLVVSKLTKPEREALAAG